MRAMTDTSDAWDREGELAAAKQDAIGAEADAIIESHERLVATALEFVDTLDPDRVAALAAEFLAMTYAARCESLDTTYARNRLAYMGRDAELGLYPLVMDRAILIIEGDKP